MPDEQAAALASLERAAAEPDREVAKIEEEEAAEQEQALAQQVDQNSQAVRMMLDIGVPFLSKLYPSLIDVYTEEARTAVSLTVGPVLTKYGINLGDMGGRYREEIAMVVVCGPIAFATFEGIKADIAARAKPVPKAPASTAQAVAPTAEPARLG